MSMIVGAGSKRRLGEDIKSPRLTVCLDSLNSIYLEEWVYAKATHAEGRDQYVVTLALSSLMPRVNMPPRERRLARLEPLTRFMAVV